MDNIIKTVIPPHCIIWFTFCIVFFVNTYSGVIMSAMAPEIKSILTTIISRLCVLIYMSILYHNKKNICIFYRVIKFQAQKTRISIQYTHDMSRSIFYKKIKRDTHGSSPRTSYICLWDVQCLLAVYRIVFVVISVISCYTGRCFIENPLREYAPPHWDHVGSTLYIPY